MFSLKVKCHFILFAMIDLSKVEIILFCIGQEAFDKRIMNSLILSQFSNFIKSDKLLRKYQLAEKESSWIFSVWKCQKIGKKNITFKLKLRLTAPCCWCPSERSVWCVLSLFTGLVRKVKPGLWWFLQSQGLGISFSTF